MTGIASNAEAGQIVRNIRTALGMSQSKLATVMAEDYGHGWFQTTVSKVEAGERPLLLLECFALGEILGVGLLDGLRPPVRWGIRHAFVCADCDFATKSRTEIREHSLTHQAVS